MESLPSRRRIGAPRVTFGDGNVAGFHETRDQIIVNNFAGDRDRPIAVPKPLFGAASSYLLEPRQPVERALQDKCRGVLVDDGGALLAADVRGNQITLNRGS